MNLLSFNVVYIFVVDAPQSKLKNFGNVVEFSVKRICALIATLQYFACMPAAPSCLQTMRFSQLCKLLIKHVHANYLTVGRFCYSHDISRLWGITQMTTVQIFKVTWVRTLLTELFVLALSHISEIASFMRSALSNATSSNLKFWYSQFFNASMCVNLLFASKLLLFDFPNCGIRIDICSHYKIFVQYWLYALKTNVAVRCKFSKNVVLRNMCIRCMFVTLLFLKTLQLLFAFTNFAKSFYRRPQHVNFSNSTQQINTAKMFAGIPFACNFISSLCEVTLSNAPET